MIFIFFILGLMTRRTKCVGFLIRGSVGPTTKRAGVLNVLVCVDWYTPLFLSILHNLRRAEERRSRPAKSQIAQIRPIDAGQKKNQTAPQATIAPWGAVQFDRARKEGRTFYVSDWCTMGRTAPQFPLGLESPNASMVIVS